MFEWTDDKIRFLQEASDYTPFNRILARKAAPLLENSDHVLDAGCGIGYLSLELSSFCRTVTAADLDAKALEILRGKILERGIANIRILEGDVFRLPEEERYDTAVFCFFGTVPEILPMIRKHVSGRAVLFKKDWTRHRFSSSSVPMKRFSYREACRELEEAGIPYHSEEFMLELGQPFRTREDVRRFFAVYDRNPDTGGMMDEKLFSRLIRTGEKGYPYYLPAEEPVGMIVFDAGEIPA